MSASIKTYTVVQLLLFISICSFSQEYQSHQLRLELVWSRVADALGEPGSVESVEFSPDGEFLVSGSKYNNSVIVWRTSDGAEIWRDYTKAEIERAGWSSDGRFVAVASEDYNVTVYHSKTGEVYKVIRHTQGIDGLTWSQNGNLLVTGEEKTTDNEGQSQGWIRVFDITKEGELKKIDFGNTVNELFFSNGDEFLLAVGHGSVKVYKTEDWSLISTFDPGYYVIFTSGAFSPDGKYIFAVGQGGTSRGNGYLWDWQENKLLKMFNHTGKKIETVTWHPGGQYILHAGHDPYIYVYRLNDILEYSNDEIPVVYKTWAGDNSEYIDFNADGSFLSSAHQNGLIKLWVWMGEDPALNSRRHNWILKQQEQSQK